MGTTSEREAGFSLLEAVIAMVVTGVLALGVAAVLVQSMDVSKGSAERTAAAAIAATRIEKYRAQRARDLTPGRETVYVDPADGLEYPVQDGTRYAVETDVSIVASSSEASLCAATSELVSYKRVRVIVDWPGRGAATQPVRADTVKTLGIGGVAAVSVLGGNLQPVSGVRVTLAPLGSATGTSVVTGTDGCAVFPELSNAKVYTIGLNEAGYVGLDGAQAVTTGGFSVDPSRVTRQTIRYDRPGSLAVQPVPPAVPTPLPASLAPLPAVQVPAALQLTATYNLWSTGTTRKYAACPAAGAFCTTAGTAQARVVPGLFPDADNAYVLWGGSCGTVQPGTAAAVVARKVAASSATAVNLPLGAVKAVVKKGSVVVPNASLTASPSTAVQAAGCLPAPTYTFTANAAGEAFLALPDGSWTLRTTGGTETAAFTITAGDVRTAPVAVSAP